MQHHRGHLKTGVSVIGPEHNKKEAEETEKRSLYQTWNTNPALAKDRPLKDLKECASRVNRRPMG